jgi:hypothetical protein
VPAAVAVETAASALTPVQTEAVRQADNRPASVK